jgi:hypothetical protein
LPRIFEESHLPAFSQLHRATPAQAAKWLAVANRLILVPISTTISSCGLMRDTKNCALADILITSDIIAASFMFAPSKTFLHFFNL